MNFKEHFWFEKNILGMNLGQKEEIEMCIFN